MGKTDSSSKHECIYTCCHKRNILCKNCVTFIKKNYDYTNLSVTKALEHRYRECKNKEFVWKVCHMNLKTGSVQLLDNSTHSKNHETEHNKKDQWEFI